MSPRAPVIARRNYILENMASSRVDPSHAGPAGGRRKEPVILAGDRPEIFRAAHFTWAVRAQLATILGDEKVV